MSVNRIIHIVPSLRRGSGVIGVVMNYYRNIDRGQIQFDFVYMLETENSFKEEIKSLGGNCYYIGKPGFMNFINVRRKFENVLKTYSYKIIHNHVSQIGMFLFSLACKNGVKEIILHSHNSNAAETKFKTLRNNILNRLTVKFSTLYFACSLKAGRFLFGDKAVDNNEVYILNNAVDLESFKFSEQVRDCYRTKFNIEDKIVIGNIGRFCIQKNQLFLIDLFNYYHKNNPNSILILVGGGEMEDDIKTRIKDLQLDKDVIFTGVRKDISSLLSMMDILVMPSLFEGLPVIGVEAQANGIPCLFSSEITEETKVLDNVMFTNLNDSVQIWSENIDNLVKQPHLKCNRDMVDYGFCIKTESEKLTKYYISRINMIKR